MADEEMRRRITLISAILTPTGRYRNYVMRVGDDFVEIVSERTDRPRTIPFRDIRNGATSNGCIIESFRQVLGMANRGGDPESILTALNSDRDHSAL